MTTSPPLDGACVAVTRPAGTGGPLVRRIRAQGGTPLLLPGSSLHTPTDMAGAMAALQNALASDCIVFISPAAVRFARRLAPLVTRARVLAPGRGTRAALRRAGIDTVTTPMRENSEGLLALPALAQVRGQRVALVGAVGGRGLLSNELAKRGAKVAKAHVYVRTAARLDARHVRALQRAAGQPLYVLLSSSEALQNILNQLAPAAQPSLLSGTAIVSSPRIAAAAQQAGFAQVRTAASAHARDLLAAVTDASANRP